MLPKPRHNTNGTSGRGCEGCPWFGDGQGFVPDKLNEQAEVLIVAQNPGSDEEDGRRITGYQAGSATYEPCVPEPLIGATGWNLDHKFLPAANLERAQVSLANAFRCRFNHLNEIPKPGLALVAVREALEHCHKAHFKMPAKTRLIVAQGAYALYATTQEGKTAESDDESGHSLSAWRGYVLPYTSITDAKRSYSDIWLPTANHVDIPVLATQHIAFGLRDPKATMLGLWDWHKIPKLLAGTWPSALPFIKQGPPSVWPKEASFDTEYDPRNRHFICYSLYDGRTLRVSEQLDPGIVPEGEIKLIMQNAPADIPFADEMLGAGRYNYEDEMLAHAVLWSDFPHDLNFLGSMYSSINRWKHLDKVNNRVYSAADAFGQWEVWQHLKRELQLDPLSIPIYERQKKLIPIIMAAEAKGVAVNPARAKEAYLDYQGRRDIQAYRAQAIAGWPMNVRSGKQVGEYLFDQEELIRILKREGSRYDA